jgi:hypothetical protein
MNDIIDGMGEIGGIFGAAYEELSEEEGERKRKEKEEDEELIRDKIQEAEIEFEVSKAVGDFDVETERQRAIPLKSARNQINKEYKKRFI